MTTSNYIVGKGDITRPYSWRDFLTGNVPPPQFQNVPQNTNYPLNGDGRYWWIGNAESPNVGPTVALLHFNGANGSEVYTDEVGNAWGGGGALSTTTPALGSAALAIAGSEISTPITAGGHLDIIQGDWTIECFVRFNDTAGTSIIWNWGDGALDSALNVVADDGVRLYLSGGNLSVQPTGWYETNAFWDIFNTTGVSFATDTWYHLAVVKNGTAATIYVDGVASASSHPWPPMSGSPDPLRVTVGGNFLSGIQNDFLNGSVDEFRASNYAVYTANFTPPSNEFSFVSQEAIEFIGDPARMVGEAALTWQIMQVADDGSTVWLQYSINGGTSSTLVQLGGDALQAGGVSIPLTGATEFEFGVLFLGGTPSTSATDWEVAVAITRNQNETLPYDTPNAFNPQNYNGSFADLSGNPDTDTLLNLRNRMLIEMGFASQVANPTPGIKAFCNGKLLSMQNYLYRRFTALSTRRFFRWKMVPGQRFYSLQDNDEDILAGMHIDPLKTIEWAGVQDTRNVWYDLIAGIPPQLYTLLPKPWRPERYDIAGCIEIYPAPDQTYFLWVRGHAGLRSFVNDTDSTTINSEVVFLHALAAAKAHYGQQDAQSIGTMADTYRKELIAGTHKTNRYIPGTRELPPATRPTMIQFNR